MKREYPMAIQPIDLQTMYSSLEKVSKLTAQKEQGIQLQGAIQQEELTKRIQEKTTTVEKADMDDDGLAHVKDQNNGESHGGSSGHREENKEEAPEETYQVITDPWLGQHIDISG